MTDTQPIPYEHLNDEITPPAYNIQHPVLWQRFLCRQPWSTTEEREKALGPYIEKTEEPSAAAPYNWTKNLLLNIVNGPVARRLHVAGFVAEARTCAAARTLAEALHALGDAYSTTRPFVDVSESWEELLETLIDNAIYADESIQSPLTDIMHAACINTDDEELHGASLSFISRTTILSTEAKGMVNDLHHIADVVGKLSKALTISKEVQAHYCVTAALAAATCLAADGAYSSPVAQYTAMQHIMETADKAIEPELTRSLLRDPTDWYIRSFVEAGLNAFPPEKCTDAEPPA